MMETTEIEPPPATRADDEHTSPGVHAGLSIPVININPAGRQLLSA